MACLTKAIKDYYVKHKGQDLPQPHVRAETAMSCHLPTNLHGFEPSNQLVAPLIIMDFTDDISTAIAEANTKIAPWKDPVLAMTLLGAGNWMMNYLPPWMARGIQTVEDMTKKVSLGCSNMAGPRVHKWVFNGKTAHWVTMTTAYFVPEITLNSMVDTCKVTISGDASQFKDFKLVLEMIEENLKAPETDA